MSMSVLTSTAPAPPPVVIPPIISVDDHLVEPADVWTSRLPARYHDRCPHVVAAPMGEDPVLDGAMYIESPGTSGKDVAWWVYEDHWYSIKRAIAAAGYPPEEVSLTGVSYEEMRRGCWDPVARLEDMTANHVEASLCFPNYPRFAGQIFLRATDKELALLCVRAYNDFMVEEWCAGSGGRLVPLCVVPLWDVELAVAELRRNAAPRGPRGGLHRVPGLARPAQYPLGVLGPVLRGLPGHWNRGRACTSGRVPGRPAPVPTRPMPCTPPTSS